ncbi:MFS transporter [uncultured Phenylobacterium sp.]|uniref:MFS transporter n=1 Tax=uncultured Phenylobacterium sp. TaxID=349273 RepID=UPI0025EC9F87|nr:MFS transporter [uncultured Phenylobacterium sp.]
MAADTKLRTLYVLAATQTLSALGSRISGLAIGIWVFQQSGQATPLALVAFFAALPMILGGGFAGALVDRFDRRLVMVLADAGAALATGLLLISFLSDGFELWHLYAITVFQAVCGTLHAPATQASIAMLAGDSQRDRANAIMQLAGPTAGVVAPALAGLLYAIIGITGAIVIDLATFVVAAAVVLRLRIPRPAATAAGLALAGSIWRQAFDGFRYLRARPVLLALCLYFTAVNFLLGGALVLITPYVLTRSGSEAALGLVFAALNAGSIAGGVLAAAIGRAAPRIHRMFGAVMAGCAFLALAGMAREAWGVGLCILLYAAMLPFMNVPFMSIMQAKIAPDVQGRVFAAFFQMAGLMMPLSYLLAGPLADRVFEPAVARPDWRSVAPLVGSEPGAGIGLMLLLGGSLSLLISLMVYANSAIRHIETDLPDYVPEAAPAADASPS